VAVYKLGKLPAKDDRRTLRLNKYLKVLEPAPRQLHADLIQQNPMYSNDRYGDCVIAARAHMTRRFEYFEQRIVVEGTDGEVLYQYWKEGGWNGTWCSKKPDNGLVILDSLNSWRKNGWTFNKKQYNIFAYGMINWRDPQELANTIFYLTGVYAGILLPKSAQNQLIWDVDDSPAGEPGSWGGHAVYLTPEYNMDTDIWTCVTWGGIKKMTTAFLAKYCDEAFGIVDNKNIWQPDSIVDVAALDAILKEITG
jgi:hypothetical protein